MIAGRRVGLILLGGLTIALAGCDAVTAQAVRLSTSGAVSDADFAALVARVSEAGGFFDTDNLISNEDGFLTVVDALRASAPRGGAFIGVGPDQSYSYIAAMAPDVVFMTDVRRDNLLHHLLLKALIERAPTRVEYLAGLHAVAPPADPAAWVDRSIEEVVAYIDGQSVDTQALAALEAEIREAVRGFGVPLSEEDFETIARFHRTFVREGLGLRFTSFGRPPRPYYPTNRQLVLGQDVDGDHASYLSSADAYGVVRDLHVANRIIPVVADLAGPSGLREIGAVLTEAGVTLSGFYTSNVEFYLWRGRTFDAWVENLRTIPATEGAVVIRSFFPNAGGRHPSAVGNYYSAQSLQRVRTLVEGSFNSYWDVVTRDVLDLRVGAGVGTGR